jgi:hypothetical protein
MPIFINCKYCQPLNDDRGYVIFFLSYYIIDKFTFLIPAYFLKEIRGREAYAVKTAAAIKGLYLIQFWTHVGISSNHQF